MNYKTLQNKKIEKHESH